MEGKTTKIENQLIKTMLSLAKRRDLGLFAFIDPAIQYTIKAKHALTHEYNPALESEIWDRRNQKIAANIARITSKNPAKRVLVTIGLEHFPFLSDLLSTNPSIDLVSPFPMG